METQPHRPLPILKIRYPWDPIEKRMRGKEFVDFVNTKLHLIRSICYVPQVIGKTLDYFIVEFDHEQSERRKTDAPAS